MAVETYKDILDQMKALAEKINKHYDTVTLETEIPIEDETTRILREAGIFEDEDDDETSKDESTVAEETEAQSDEEETTEESKSKEDDERGPDRRGTLCSAEEVTSRFTECYC